MPEGARRPAPSLTHLLAPFREQVAARGITDEELEKLIEETRREVFRERKQSSPR